MRHLTREELIDSLEQTLPAAREAHVDTCTQCRGERESLRRVLDRVVAVDLPEPSPLFWDHFSAHVRERVAQEPVPRPSLWTAWRWPNWAVATATLLCCVTLAWFGAKDYRHGLVRHGATSAAGQSADYGPVEGVALPTDSPSDEDWNLVVSMAEDVTVDESDEAGLTVKPGATERAMADLSSEQRRELAKLLTAEMGRPSS